jgi:hypothetical protein
VHQEAVIGDRRDHREERQRVGARVRGDHYHEEGEGERRHRDEHLHDLLSAETDPSSTGREVERAHLVVHLASSLFICEGRCLALSSIDSIVRGDVQSPWKVQITRASVQIAESERSGRMKVATWFADQECKYPLGEANDQ